VSSLRHVSFKHHPFHPPWFEHPHNGEVQILRILKFYVVGTVHLEMKLYNDQCNAQVFNLSIYFCLICFWLSFSPSSEAGVQFWQWF
jgi:hypothetical protein